VRVAAQRVSPTYSSAEEYPAQINPLYPGQVPPSYQQGYPYHPPPYEEHQKTKPAAHMYSAGATVASEQPPPYSDVLQESSGGVRSQNTYGAIPNPSLPV